ncbi:MAG: DUF4338 domain-containing protein [Patescibacteria group bacterium]|nr:DUF4338 domain-containing protein [Patescibacteria group bacterium]
MLQLDVKKKINLDTLFEDLAQKDNLVLEEKVKLLILRDLLRLNWKIDFDKNKIVIAPPENYDKETVRLAMSHKRKESIGDNAEWIRNNIEFARNNLADGKDVLRSKIKPIIEVCESPRQHDLFRLYRYYWSSAHSEYVGRRIKLIIRDGGLPNKPVIGIAALGSPIIHIPDRDNWIGWDKNLRTKNLIYAMDAYVIGALPPYNYLLGGKLVSYVLASNEVRKIYKDKYKNKITLIDKKKASDLVCIFTTSLYGKSAQYNRVKYKSKLLYMPIGETRGFGTLHLSSETLDAMLELLFSKGIFVTNKFGDGPSWSMRVIRTVGDMLNFDSDFLLRHSFKRGIYVVRLASNFRNFLNGKDKKPKYYNYSLKNLVSFWKKRWFKNRKQNIDVIQKVEAFNKSDFNIL